MKKIISAALLLAAGTALANADTFTASEANAVLGQYLANYTGGQSYSLSFTISAYSSSSTNAILSLGDDSSAYYLISQNSAYLGLSYSSGSMRNASNVDPNSWADSKNDGEVTNTFTSDGKLYSWISKNTSGNNGTHSIGGTNVSISYDADSKATTLVVDFAKTSGDKAKEVVVMSGTEIEFSDIAFQNNGSLSVSDIVITGIAAAPEPSAFGLLAGLGALAFVAARRRRSRKAA